MSRVRNRRVLISGMFRSMWVGGRRAVRAKWKGKATRNRKADWRMGRMIIGILCLSGLLK